VKKLQNIIILLVLFTYPSFPSEAGSFKNLDDYPSLREVALRYLLSKDLKKVRNQPPGSYHFMRTPAGWYVRIDDSSSPMIQINERDLIWSRVSGYPGGLKKTDISGGLKDPSVLAGVINNMDLYNFSIHPFYGYIGWGEDVISYYRGMGSSELDDNELYGLARAFGQKASDIFWAHNRFSDTSRQFVKQGSETAIQQYLYFAEASLNRYRDLLIRSPHYYTLIGNMDVKFANEVMSHWYELTLFGYPDEAQYLLESYSGKRSLYQDFWMEYAVRLLTGLPQDAILFTNGDNDTYPLLYQQHAQGLRQDVLIINIALLKDPLYFIKLKNSRLCGSQLHTGLSDKEILKLKNHQLVIADEKSTMGLDFTITKSEIQMGFSTGNQVIPLSGGTYFIPAKNGSISVRNNKRPTVSTSEYIFTDLVNQGIPSICFAKTISLDYLELVDPENIVDQGFHYILKGDQNAFNQISGYLFDEKAYIEVLSSRFTPPEKAKKARTGFYRQVIQMHSRYLQYIILSQPEIFTCDSIKAFLNLYPPELTGANLFYYEILFLAFQGDQNCIELATTRMVEFLKVLRSDILELKMRDEDPNDYGNLHQYRGLVEIILKYEDIAAVPGMQKELNHMLAIIDSRLNEIPEIHFN
jgi:hypothetical protein